MLLSQQGHTPLHEACIGAHADCVRCLVEEMKADVNARSQVL